MIIGIGTDLVDIRRIEKVMARYETRFINRCFTQDERATAQKRQTGGSHIATYAKRFAAKEACLKALGTGLAKGITFQNLNVTRDNRGKPEILLTGPALAHLNSLLPADTKPLIHLSLSDELPFAQAFVIIEAVRTA